MNLAATLRRRAAETPEHPAILFEGATITYGELDARASRLAHALRAHGVGLVSSRGARGVGLGSSRGARGVGLVSPRGARGVGRRTPRRVGRHARAAGALREPARCARPGWLPAGRARRAGGVRRAVRRRRGGGEPPAGTPEVLRAIGG